MRKTLRVFLLLAVFGGTAVAEPDDGACLATPTYDCLVAGARAAVESEPDRGERARLFAFLAGAQALGGRREDAAESLERAFACARSIDEVWQREYFATLVIWAKAGIGEIEEAAELAAHVESPYDSAFAWSSLAEGQALNGDLEGAARSLRMAEFAADLNEDWGDGYVRAFLAISFAYAGQPDRAHEFAHRADDMDVEESGLDWVLYARAAAAVAEAIAGHDEDSAAFVAEARARDAELEENGSRAILLGFVSWAHAERGDRDAMLAAIREMAALDLGEATAAHRADALALAAMALGRAGL